MLRRTLELSHFFVPAATINWEFHDLLTAASDVEIIQKYLHWHDMNRYSSRQKTEMKLGGFIGKITLKGPLEPFIDILRTSEILHVGKATSFGLGKIRLET